MLERMYREAPYISHPIDVQFACYPEFTRIYGIHAPRGSSVPIICFVDVQKVSAPSSYQDLVWEVLFDVRSVKPSVCLPYIHLSFASS